MTTSTRVDRDLVVVGAARSPRPLDVLLAAQLAGIDAWHRRLHEARAAAQTPGLSREQRLDAARRLDVRLREQAALRAHAGSEHDCPFPLLQGGERLTAVVVHRHAWTRQQLVRGLSAAGAHVLDVGDNGADAVGTCVSAQPSVLVVDDRLAMRSGAEVLAEVRPLCPGTLLAGYVDHQPGVGQLLDAGAHLVSTRRVAPVDDVARLHELVRPS